MNEVRELQMRLLGITAGLAVVIVLTQIFTLYVNLYSIYPQFDNFMHFMGGLFVAYLIYTISLKYFPNKITRHLKLVFYILLSVFIVGFLWEVFEFFVDLLVAQNGQDYVDSGTDLVFDMIGALFASLLIWRFHIPEKKEDEEALTENSL